VDGIDITYEKSLPEMAATLAQCSAIKLNLNSAAILSATVMKVTDI